MLDEASPLLSVGGGTSAKQYERAWRTTFLVSGRKRQTLFSDQRESQ